MEETSTSPATMLQFRQDIEAQFRRHIRDALDVALAEELAAALGSARHERTDGRRGYRNGTVERTITTPEDRKSTRLNSSHRTISYAVFCLKKKKKKKAKKNATKDTK